MGDSMKKFLRVDGVFMQHLRRKTTALSMAALFAGGTICGSISPTVAQASKVAITDFTDMTDSSAWYYGVVNWAIDKGISSGYPDHTFRAEQTITEAEFVTMLINFFPNGQQKLAELGKQVQASDGQQHHWADNVYGVAKLFNLPVWGDANVVFRDQPITRGKVAVIIAGGLGSNYNIDGSVAFLFDKGLSNGRTSKTIDGFESNGLLTRAEALAFLKGLQDKGFGSNLQTRPITQSSNPSVSKYNSPAPTPIQAPIQKPSTEETSKPISPQKQQYLDLEQAVVDTLQFDGTTISGSLPDLPEGFYYAVSYGGVNSMGKGIGVNDILKTYGNQFSFDIGTRGILTVSVTDEHLDSLATIFVDLPAMNIRKR